MEKKKKCSSNMPLMFFHYICILFFVLKTKILKNKPNYKIFIKPSKLFLSLCQVITFFFKKKKTSKVEAWMGWQNLSSAKMGHLGLNLKKNQNYKVA
jgi:hypothetical protein